MTDFLIGAYGISSSVGRAYLVYGSANLTNLNFVNMHGMGISINGTGTTAYTGISVSDAGDVNKDGYADFLIGASGYSSSDGRAYLIFGNSSLSNIKLAPSSLSGGLGIVITGPSGGTTARAISAAGNHNFYFLFP